LFGFSLKTYRAWHDNVDDVIVTDQRSGKSKALFPNSYIVL